MEQAQLPIVERLKTTFEDDHERGCEGRCYSCSCGFDDANARTGREAADLITKLVNVVNDAVHAIEHQDLNARMCCDGHMCGCQGSTNADFLLHNLRAALTLATNP